MFTTAARDTPPPVRHLGSLSIACVLAASAPTSPAAASTPIIGGTIDTGDPAVVMVAAYSTDHTQLFTCTGVVVAPKAVLTAAHCVDHPGFEFGVFFAADASAFPTADDLVPQLAAVTAVHPHPSYSTEPPFLADIAVIDLAVPTAVPALDFIRTPPTVDMVGKQVEIIGYGELVFGQNNAARYAATTTISALDDGADTILIGDTSARTCVGDSGGPALLDGKILGIDSYSDTTGCADPAHFRRTDAYADFIDQFAGTSPNPPPPPPPSGSDDPPVSDPADGGGGCSTSGGAGSLMLLGIALAACTIRRRC